MQISNKNIVKIGNWQKHDSEIMHYNKKTQMIFQTQVFKKCKVK